MMQTSNNGQVRSNFSHTYNQNNIKLGGNRMIKGTTSVTLPDCPCKDTCKGGACSCAECSTTNKSNTIWTQNIIPVAANIRSSTRHNADMIRGDITIKSAQAPNGWFKTAHSNRLIEKGARGAVFGVN